MKAFENAEPLTRTSEIFFGLTVADAEELVGRPLLPEPPSRCAPPPRYLESARPAPPPRYVEPARPVAPAIPIVEDNNEEPETVEPEVVYIPAPPRAGGLPSHIHDMLRDRLGS